MLCVQWVIGHLFLFLLSKISISTLEKYYFFISLSTLEARDQNFKFLFLLSKFEIRISNFSFYSRNSRSESQISLSTLEIRDQNFKFLFLLSNLLFLTLVNACTAPLSESSNTKYKTLATQNRKH